MKVILILQETPLDFVGDKQWVVYANQVPFDTHIPSIYMWPRNFFLTQYFSKGNVYWNIPVRVVYQCNISLSYTQDHRTQVPAKRTTEGTFPPGLIKFSIVQIPIDYKLHFEEGNIFEGSMWTANPLVPPHEVLNWTAFLWFFSFQTSLLHV